MTTELTSSKYVLALADDRATLETVGGKGASLARLVAAGPFVSASREPGAGWLAVTSPGQAEPAINDLVDAGADLVKIYVEEPTSGYASVQDAITAMSEARSGACIITRPDRTLAGIFTHGDFARAYQEDPGVGERPVAEFMTTDPVSVPASHLAVEAVKTIGAHRIDDIVVTDEDRKPVGLVDSQDLARLKIV